MDFSFIADEEQRALAIAEYEKNKNELESTWKKQIDAKIAEATTGLKSKNDELLAEKKKMQERFKGIKDPEEALEALRLVTENEDVRLIREGRLDEVIEKRVSTLRSDYEAKVGELSSTLEQERTGRAKYEEMFKSKMIEDTLRDAALAAKIRPEALPDVVMRGMRVFSLSEDNTTVEARDSRGKLLKNADEKILTPTLWIDGLKSTAPHFWPESESARFDSGGGDLDDLERAMNAAADRGDTKEYRRLRSKLSKGRGK